MLRLLFLFLLLIPQIAFSATIYVDATPGGNCTGNYSIANRACTGSDGNSYTTVAGGIAAIASWDTLYIRDGTYSENNIGLNSNSTMKTIQGYPGDDWPVLFNSYTGGEGTAFIRLYNDANNITVKDLKFTATSRNQYGTYGFGSTAGNGGYVIVDHCWFRDIEMGVRGGFKYWIKNCIFEDWGHAGYNDHAIYLFGNNGSWANASIIEYNWFNNTGYIGAAVHFYENCSYVIMRYNVAKEVLWGFITRNGQYGRVYNNSFYAFTDGVVIQQESAHFEIINNIFFGPASDTISFEAGVGETIDDVTIKNNLTNGANIYTVNGEGTITNLTVADNITSDDPEFVDSTPDSFEDFRLQATSPAIGAGLNLGADHDDALDPNDTSWPPSTVDQDEYGNWEIGAFVYGATVPKLSGVTLFGGSMP